MKVTINKKILDDYKANITWHSFNRSDSEIIESLLKNELIKHGIDGYEIDELTGLITFSRFRNDINALITNILQKKQDNFYKALIYFNIKDLKEYMDVKGLQEGDKLISQFAEQLLKIYSEYKIYRIGGQEFLLVSFCDIDMKQKLYINDIELRQYYIELIVKEIKYPIKKDFYLVISNQISKINNIKKEKKYRLKL